MFFEPPNLSDKEAYELCDWLQELVMAIEGHYCIQLRRYLKSLERGSTLPPEIQIDPDEEFPF